MAVYGIHYTLKKVGQDYEDLYKAIKSYGFYNHVTTSSWFIKTTESPEQIYNKLTPYLDQNDIILIIEVKPNYYGYLPGDDWDWFRKAFS